MRCFCSGTFPCSLSIEPYGKCQLEVLYLTWAMYLARSWHRMAILSSHAALLKHKHVGVTLGLGSGPQKHIAKGDAALGTAIPPGPEASHMAGTRQGHLEQRTEESGQVGTKEQPWGTSCTGSRGAGARGAGRGGCVQCCEGPEPSVLVKQTSLLGSAPELSLVKEDSGRH